MTRERYTRTLSGDDVDALFAGRYDAPKVTTCDNCAMAQPDENVLTFGDPSAVICPYCPCNDGDDEMIDVSSWVFEMPYEISGELGRELQRLRMHHRRQLIILCYSCVDALQAPISGRVLPRLTMNVRSATPPSDEVPRLFAVE